MLVLNCQWCGERLTILPEVNSYFCGWCGDSGQIIEEDEDPPSSPGNVP